MSVSIDDLPLEIIPLILGDLDQASLLSVIRTAHFLRPHAERLLYRKVDLREVRSSKRRTIAFLTIVIRNPRLGSLVISFCPHSFIDCANTDEFNDLFADAAKFLPNLTTLVIGRQDVFYPKWLGGDFSQAPPFHLQRLSLHLFPESEATCDVTRFLLEVLQCQPSLFHMSVWLHGDDAWGGFIREPDLSIALETIHLSLDTLEGTNSIIRLLLPKQRVKALYWECDRPEDEPLRPVADLETESRLRDTFFTPGLCEAYGRLEHLVLVHRISLLPMLSLYLSSLKTLKLFASMITDDHDLHSTECNEALFIRAIGEMEHLEVLEVTWTKRSRHAIDPNAIFATCRNLKRFVLTMRGIKNVYRADCVERGKDGSVHYVRYRGPPDLPMHLRFEVNWFYF